MYIKGYHYIPLRNYTYDPNKFKFISQLSKREPYTIDFILQDDANGFMHFIIQNSRGFSRSGVERINDSIRIMGAQAQTRSAIIGNSGPSFEAQKQFLFLMEDCTHGKPTSIPESIERYQSAITNTHVRLNFALGESLYLIPSDMNLPITSKENYNNNINVATKDMTFGLNDVNAQSNIVEFVPMVDEKSKINRMSDNKQVPRESPPPIMEVVQREVVQREVVQREVVKTTGHAKGKVLSVIVGGIALLIVLRLFD